MNSIFVIDILLLDMNSLSLTATSWSLYIEIPDNRNLPPSPSCYLQTTVDWPQPVIDVDLFLT